MRPIINTLLDPIVNFGKVTVSPVGYTSIATEVTLVTGDGSKLPNPINDGSFNLVWFNNSTYSDPADDPYVEIVRCIVRVGDTLTLMRHQEGTSASDKNIPTKVYKMILSPTKKIIDDIQSDAQTRADITVESHRLIGIHALPQPSQTLPNRSSFTAMIINAQITGTFLPNIPIPDGFTLIVRANIENIGNVYIANNITNATTSGVPGNRITLSAGDAVKLYVTNANIIAVASSTTGDNVDILVEQ